uniref:Uncharacterized protein n=1 Tax=Anguilla anguilla TaxID=7936 RepID=A0A0E9Q3B3_ANGAN
MISRIFFPFVIKSSATSLPPVALQVLELFDDINLYREPIRNFGQSSPGS